MELLNHLWSNMNQDFFIVIVAEGTVKERMYAAVFMFTFWL